MSWENTTSCNREGKVINLTMFPAFRNNFPKQLQLVFGSFRSQLLLLQYTIGRSGKQAVYYSTTVNPKREGKYTVTFLFLHNVAKPYKYTQFSYISYRRRFPKVSLPYILVILNCRNFVEVSWNYYEERSKHFIFRCASLWTFSSIYSFFFVRSYGNL